MPLFRRTPLEVMAWRVEDLVVGHEGKFRLPLVIQLAMGEGRLSLGRDTENRPYAMITTPEGRTLGEEGDWIIEGPPLDQLEVCKPHKFYGYYEPVPMDTAACYKRAHEDRDRRPSKPRELGVGYTPGSNTNATRYHTVVTDTPIFERYDFDQSDGQREGGDSPPAGER